jgi:ATP-dependent exoDNAse (exonuclease V) beta subunit
LDGETLATVDLEEKALSTDKLAERVSSWEPVAVDEIMLDSPSSLKLSGEVPEPIGFQRLPWPKTSGGSDGGLFGGEQAKGTAFHYVMEHWCFGAGRTLDDDLFVEALEHVGFDTEQGRVDAAVAGLRELTKEIQGVGSLFDELSQAAKSGEVYHEVPVRFRDRETGRYLTGSVDLVWRDSNGIYHVLDYKSGSAYPTLDPGVDPLKHEKIQEHYPQVAAYARGLNQLLDTPVEDFGLWFVPAGLVVRWASPAATGATGRGVAERGREASTSEE